VGWLDRRIEAAAKLLRAQNASLVLVPICKPLPAQRFKFRFGQFSVLVLIALFQKIRCENHRRAYPARLAKPAGPSRSAGAARTAEEPSAAAFRLHGFPLVGCEFQMHRPN